MAATESYPGELKYHREHDWARIEDDEAVLGLTWVAQEAAGEGQTGTVAVDSVPELFRDIPAGVDREGELSPEPPLSEQELTRELERLAARNVDTARELSFLGAGMYDHYVPAVVDAVLQRGELLTAYTPYQPEMSQGVLQAIFEYQTAICELTGMDGWKGS